MQKFSFAFICILYSTISYAQFGEPKLMLPHDSFLNHINLGDLNGDGQEDLVAHSPFAWYEGIGEGKFKQQHLITEQSPSVLSKIEIVDLDEDGDLDLLLAERSNKRILWYENDGLGNFDNQHTIVADLNVPQDFVLDDWDKDGDRDLIVTVASSNWAADKNGKILKFKNSGKGNFVADGTIISSIDRGYLKIFLADLTNNGHKDIVVNHSDEGVIIFDNLGEGFYETHQDTNQPNELPLYETPYISDLKTFEVSFVDLNEDGYLDIIPRFDNFDNIVWYENNQSGRFMESHLVFSDFYDFQELEMVDIDKDGDMDMVFGGDGISWLKNEGNGVFGAENSLLDFAGVYHVGDIVARDFNEDGFLDLLISDSRLLLYFFEGKEDLSFERFTSNMPVLEDCLIDEDYNWQDVNNDGFKDLVFYKENYHGEYLFWYENNKIGGFHLAQPLLDDLPELYNSPIIQFVDVNNDSFEDLIIGPTKNESKLRVYLNESDGSYTEMGSGGITKIASELDAADLDNDGDVDFILMPSSSNSPLIKALNDGSGTFTTTNIEVVSENISWRDIIVEDLNNDGLKDIFLQSYVTIYWMENQGAEGFGELIEIGSFDDVRFAQILLKDMTNDGYLDVLASVDSSPLQQYIYLYENKQGAGFKSRIPILQSENPIRGWQFNDIDQDEDQDLILNTESYSTEFPGNQWSWYENKGDYHLAETGIPIAYVESFWHDAKAIAIDDIDNDGDNDFLLHDNDYDGHLFFVENFYNVKLSITGHTFWDSNENGIYDLEEYPLTVHKTILEPTANAAFTTNEGKFFYSVSPDTYQLTYEPNSLWELSTSDEEFTINVTGEEILPFYNFGFKPTRVLPRVNPYINASFTRCNAEVNYWLTYSNTGTTIANGTITLEINDLMEFLSSNPEPDAIEDGRLTWNFSDLPPTQEGKITLQFQMPGFNSMGEIIETQATVQLFNESEELVYSKSTDYNSEVLCSYDPNDKLVRSNLLGQSETAYINDTLQYTIRFQNTGNDTAFNIRIEDVLDKTLDWTTFHPITASHDYRTELNRETGLVTFYFDDIMLPDSTINEPDSHGFVLFGIASLPDIGDKTEVENTASIFFDFNPPIITNTVSTVLIELDDVNIGDSVLDIEHSILIRPNPFSDYTTIEVNGIPEGKYQLEVMDILGRKVRTLTLEGGKVRLERGKLESGVYLIRVLKEGNSEVIGGGKVLVE